MNEVFSWQRFALLWRSYWIERWQELAGFLCAGGLLNIIACIFFIVTTSKSYSVFQQDEQAVWFTFTLFLTGSIFSGIYARRFSSHKANIIFFQQPASLTEKTLLAFIIVAIVFPVVFTLSITLLNLPFIKLAQSLYVPCQSCQSAYDSFRPFIPFLSSGANIGFDTSTMKLQYLFLSSYWCIQALVVGCFIFFKRFPVLALIISGCLIFFSSLGLNALPTNSAFWLIDANKIGEIGHEELLLSLIEWLLLPFALWLIVYFHLRERQI